MSSIISPGRPMPYWSMAPEVEPPLGFEVRLLSRMGNGEVGSRRHVPQRWLLACAAAVVALAAGLSIGLVDAFIVSQREGRDGKPTRRRPSRILTASLMRGRPHGRGEFHCTEDPPPC